jgi:hypothetical protein
MSLMFAKQFSEAGVTGGGQGRKGGRGKAGSGLMSKPKGRNRRDGDDTGGGDSSSGGGGGLFNTDSSYRTHMLFPGRKDEETMGGGPEPRRSSGSSPGFMKTMMSWGKRPSGSAGPPGTEMGGGSGGGGRYRTTPTRTESELVDRRGGGAAAYRVDHEPLLSPSSFSPSHAYSPSSPPSSYPVFDPLLCRKTVSFHEGFPPSLRGEGGGDLYYPRVTPFDLPTNRQNGEPAGRLGPPPPPAVLPPFYPPYSEPYEYNAEYPGGRASPSSLTHSI